MRTLQTLCLIGICSGAVAAVMLRDSNAADVDPRAKKIEDASISGLKVPVPTSADAEGALVRKEKELIDKEALLREREEQIAVEEQRLKIRIDEYQKLHDEITAMQTANKKDGKEIMAKLVKTFQSMAPKKASAVVSAMNDQLGVELLLNMKEKSAAAILEAMDPSRAMSLSTLVAERRPAGKAIGEKQAQ